jgi:hypothetical protein
MASAWIERHRTPGGQLRYRVKFTLGGSGSRKRYAGSFKTMREAAARKQWVSGELAGLRVPNVRILQEQEPAPTFAEAAGRWQASRIDAAENTKLQHRSAINRALPTFEPAGWTTSPRSTSPTS